MHVQPGPDAGQAASCELDKVKDTTRRNTASNHDDAAWTAIFTRVHQLLQRHLLQSYSSHTVPAILTHGIANSLKYNK